MDIKGYMKKNGLSQEAFGKKVGVSQSMVHQWIHGLRPISALSAVMIERKTAGEISKVTLRKDIFGGAA
jgi:DNA-binding transcriptional regulator YdaS (Cro superfamily)